MKSKTNKSLFLISMTTSMFLPSCNFSFAPGSYQSSFNKALPVVFNKHNYNRFDISKLNDDFIKN